MKMQWQILLRVVLVCLVLPITSNAQTIVGGMTVHQAFPDGRVANLVEATVRGDYSEADKQLKVGADVNYVGTDGLSPLLWVVYEAFQTRNYRGTEYLLKAGANPNYREAKRKASAMYYAAGGNSPELLELLLKYNGDPNLVGLGGPLMHVAVMQSQRKINLELLLKYGADINSVDGGETAASTAAGLGRFDLVAWFLESGLSYDLQGLARDVEIVHVRPTSDAQRWKDKVIAMLKQRGVKFPAFVPKPRQNLNLPGKF